MKVIYIADDGKEFDDEWECKDYEWKLNHPHLKDICCYDKDGNKFDDIFSENTYYYTMKIVVLTDEAARELRELANYTGYCEYADISEAGVWEYKEGRTVGSFEKVKEIE